MTYSKTDIQQELIFYIDLYLKKRGLRMKPVLRTIKKALRKNVPITPKQFYSIIKFIEREVKFINNDRNQIIEYFKPIMINNSPPEAPLHNLDTILS